jgi:hypothetical protein
MADSSDSEQEEFHDVGSAGEEEEVDEDEDVEEDLQGEGDEEGEGEGEEVEENGEVEGGGGKTNRKHSETRPSDPTKPTASANPDLGFRVVSAMSESDLDFLINRLEAEAPQIDVCTVGVRVKRIDWNTVAFEGYTGAECRAAWEYVRSLTRKFRIMSEVVREIKLVAQTDKDKFRSKLIEAAPGFPKKPPTNGAQMFCREMWNMNPKKVNFILVSLGALIHIISSHGRWYCFGIPIIKL